MTRLLDLTVSEFTVGRNEYCKEELKHLWQCSEPDGSSNKELLKRAYKDKEFEFIKAYAIKRTNEEEFHGEV